ncbi:hypothetical protein [Rhodococcus sp. NPDC057529]|uniref:hypothetical protein n=1 Tax=Rhodococcus sp. NPDC057529 TaxID=3346158 RepID=UPI00366F2279
MPEQLECPTLFLKDGIPTLNSAELNRNLVIEPIATGSVARSIFHVASFFQRVSRGELAEKLAKRSP